MKLIILIFLTFLIPFDSIAQESTHTLTTVNTAPVITQCAELKDTKECFNESLRNHILQNVDVSVTGQSSGKAYVQFVISETGTIEDVRVRAEKKSHQREAKRVIEALEPKAPATYNGVNVSMVHSVPVLFNSWTYKTYAEFFNSKDYTNLLNNLSQNENAVFSVSKTAFLPLYSECASFPEENECFERTTISKLQGHLNTMDQNFKTNEKIEYQFEIDKNGQVQNPIVKGPEPLVQSVTTFLKNLDFQRPARNEDKEPIKSSYVGILLF